VYNDNNIKNYGKHWWSRQLQTLPKEVSRNNQVSMTPTKPTYLLWREMRKNSIGKICEVIMAKTFSNLMKDMNLNGTPSMINTKYSHNIEMCS
jgi:hypothetical protein